MADLVGLRFSVVHLRLAGYGLLAVWISEIAGVLSSPLLQAIGTRLHYISQALDLSPLLLVGLALIAFQGGLQRSLVERLLLPLLFGALPILSALHFLMAPASIANALTLSGKQTEVSRSQLRSIEAQLDRAGMVLQRSKDLEGLRRRLDAIPGVRVSSSPDLSLEKARREVAESLQNERRRVRAQIGVSTAQAREQFTRRATQNAAMAVLIGVVLAWIRAASLQEMDLSATYLAWVVVSDPEAGRVSGLKDLLDFQKACLATSYLTLIERLLKLASNPADKEEEERQKQLERELLERLEVVPAEEPPLAPWEPATMQLRSEAWRRRAGVFQGRLSAPADGEPFSELEMQEAEPPESHGLSPREIRRQQRDREQVLVAMTNFARTVSSFDSSLADEQKGVIDRPRRRPSKRKMRQAREALERFALQFEEDFAEAAPADATHADAMPPDPLGFDPEAVAGGGEPADALAAPTAAEGSAIDQSPADAAPPLPPPPPPPRSQPGGPLRRALDWLITQL